MALNDTPQAGQSLNVTQNPIRQNFITIDTAFSIDHAAYGSANVGKHNKISFPLQAAAPAFIANEIGLFNQNAAPTNRPDIWMARGAAAAIPITGYVLGGTNAGNGWTYLPSGLLMAWGRSTTGAATNVTITYANELTNFPGFTTVNAFPQLTRISGAGTSTNFVTLTAYNQTTFQVYSSAAGTQVQFAWLVIGI